MFDNFQVTPEILASIAGALLSLLFSYIPKFAPWFQKQDPTTKRLINAGALAAVVAGIFGLACNGIIRGVTCDQPGLVHLVWSYILALAINQGIYSASKRKTAANAASTGEL